MRQLAHIRLFLTDFNHKLAVTLISAVLPVTNRSDAHANRLTLLHGGNRLHRRSKINHIQLPAQTFRQGGAQEVDHKLLAFASKIHADLAAAQTNNDAARAITAATEINIPNELDISTSNCFGFKHSLLCGRLHGRGCCHWIQQYQQGLALPFSTVRSRRLQIQH
ncbi:MAG: hypothetical protein AUG53_27745 [Delftia sp. 13_1_20CM_4_67_18]|nr:MAG: hypothetical protein AUG53_27745 [Delftia sp. 13_1_20CM_4_67_18]